jgi:hypothetical protein
MENPAELLRDVGQQLLHPRTLGIWQDFMREHEEAFGAAAGAGAGGPAAEAKHGGSSGGGGDTEHRLEAHDVYRQFTAMVERQLEEALAGKGVAVGDFMRLSADLADDGGSSGIEDDQALQAFLQLVLGATDFLVFSDVMRDTAKRQYYFQIMAMWHTSMGREAK